MALSLTIARSLREAFAISDGRCFVAPATLADGLTPGDVVWLRTPRGRAILARLAVDPAVPPATVQLDRYQRQALKARLGEPVTLERADAPPVRQLTLLPAVDVWGAHQLEEHLRQSFAAHATPVAVGSVLYCQFRDSPAGTTYKVLDVRDGPGVVDATTELRIEYGQVMTTDAVGDVTFEDVGGLDRQIQLVRELIQLPLQYPQIYRQLGINAPRGILFYGPPGAGKTHLARAVANEVDARFYYISGPEVVGTLYGETEGNLRKIFAEATHHAPSVIVIDELDALAPKRGATGAHSDTRAVTQLLALMDGLRRVDGVIVIGTTNRIEAIDLALRRPGRFDREIFIGPPNTEGRLAILEIHTREMPLAPDGYECLPDIARATPGFVGADLMELCREAGLNALRRYTQGWTPGQSPEALDPLAIRVGRADFEAALTRVRPSALREALVTIPDVSWDDIGGLHAQKARLRELIERPLQQRHLYQELGVSPSTGILLYGPPGTGKTLLARAIAHECEVNFLPVEGPEIFTKWLGESEETIRHIFRVARQLAPTIIFFDQLDALAPHRGRDLGSQTTERVVNQLLTELDGLEPLGEVIVLGATNRLDLIDPSVLRPGRFSTHILVPLPEEADRAEILRIHLRGVPLAADSPLEAIVGYLVPRTAGWSGADLRLLCDEAKLLALQEAADGPVLRLEHFVRALSRLPRATAPEAAAED
ncbi:MAG TPA: AAA family ATPase [Chloroflexota bacterium]|nr:AAA family ATPase [Chloroflexota bacterium]HZU05224.1 AAA family ATPase [Chloroflexota bacterium]